MDQLPLLPTMGVGSYASPGWFVLFRSQMRDGRIGPDDLREELDDATRIAVLDQIEAGIDILTDGEGFILERNVDVHVSAVRKKLGESGNLVVTVRGVGYKCRD